VVRNFYLYIKLSNCACVKMTQGGRRPGYKQVQGSLLGRWVSANVVAGSLPLHLPTSIVKNWAMCFGEGFAVYDWGFAQIFTYT
jgi:hypothetical protein